jgi:hypothetical protein
VVGVPEIAPEEDSVRPGGRDPEVMVQVKGAVPPVAFNCALYPCPTVPGGRLVVEIANGLTERVAKLLVTLPIALLTITSKVVLLSAIIVAGVV